MGTYAPVSATLFVLVGTPPHVPAQTVVSEIRALLTRAQQQPSLDARIEIHTRTPVPFVPDQKADVLALEAAQPPSFAVSPIEPRCSGYSDASVLCGEGIPAVNYGPAGQATAATDESNESVRIEDLVNCARVYTDLIVRICGPKAYS